MDTTNIDFSSVERAQKEVNRKVVQRLTKRILKKAGLTEGATLLMVF